MQRRQGGPKPFMLRNRHVQGTVEIHPALWRDKTATEVQFVVE
jgi:hypothetical protein